MKKLRKVSKAGKKAIPESNFLFTPKALRIRTATAGIGLGILLGTEVACSLMRKNKKRR